MLRRCSLLLFSLLMLGGMPLFKATAAPASESAKPLILVTGVTGKQGGAAAEHLLERGFRVRGLTRDPEQPEARALAQRGVDLVEGDFTDPPSIERAAADVHGMFLNSPSTVPDEASVGAAVIDAAKRAGVKHVVYTSYYHAHPQHGLATSPKSKVEEHLRRSGAQYTILRPGTFMENILNAKPKLLTQGFREARPPDHKQQFISTHDIGFFVAEAFSHPDEWTGRSLEIAADELTPPQLAQLYSDVLGEPVAYRQIAWEEMDIPPRYLDTVRWSVTSPVRANVQGLRARYPNLLTYRQFLEQHWGRGGASSPVGIANEFHAALKAGDREKVLELLAADCVVMEQGHIERSRDEYAAHHLPADLKFSKQVSYTLERQTSEVGESVAWVASEGRVQGDVDGKPINQISLETLALKKVDGVWRIAHVHWSSRKAEQ